MKRSIAVQPDLPVFPEGRSPVSVESRERNRGRAFVRLFVLLQCMQTRYGATIEQLARETGVTTRTIRRDLEVLQEVGIPLVDETDIESDVTTAKRWRVLGRDLSDLLPGLEVR